MCVQADTADGAQPSSSPSGPPTLPSALPSPLNLPLPPPFLLPKTWKMMTSTCAKTSLSKCSAMRTVSPIPPGHPPSGTSGSCHGQTRALDRRGPDPGGSKPSSNFLQLLVKMVTADGWEQLACWTASRAEAECRMVVVHVVVGGVVLNRVSGGVAYRMKMV
jgi:uncharacterized protein YjeT (DUF2065 family)